MTTAIPVSTGTLPGTVAHEVGTDGADTPEKGGAADAMSPGAGSMGGGHGHHH